MLYFENGSIKKKDTVIVKVNSKSGLSHLSCQRLYCNY